MILKLIAVVIRISLLRADESITGSCLPENSDDARGGQTNADH
jgi:hypothetical protein